MKVFLHLYGKNFFISFCTALNLLILFGMPISTDTAFGFAISNEIKDASSFAILMNLKIICRPCK